MIGKEIEYCYYMKSLKSGMLDGITKGFSVEYAQHMISLGYVFITKAEYNEIYGKDLAISYDYE